MKQIFSTKWKASNQPRKQRKYAYNAPNHIRRKFMSATLDKALRITHKRRSLEVRKGDVVKIMRGKFKGQKGKIEMIDVAKTKVSVEGVQRTKADGTKIPVWITPSNLKITEIGSSDNRRFKTKEKSEVSKEKSKENEGEKNAPKKK